MPYANNQTRENSPGLTCATRFSDVRKGGTESSNVAFFEKETAAFSVPSFMLPVSPVPFIPESRVEEEQQFNAAKYLGITALAVAIISLLLFVWTGSAEKNHLHGQVPTNQSIVMR